MDINKDSLGCGGFLGLLLVIGLIIEYFEVFLALTGLLVVGALLFLLLSEAVRKAEASRRCPVCQNWSKSVLLSDLNADNVSLLCPKHAQRHRRLWELEQAVRPWEA